MQLKAQFCGTYDQQNTGETAWLSVANKTQQKLKFLILSLKNLALFSDLLIKEWTGNSS